MKAPQAAAIGSLLTPPPPPPHSTHEQFIRDGTAIINHFATFGRVLCYFLTKKVKTRIFIQKWLDFVIIMTPYLVTLATVLSKLYQNEGGMC